MDRIECPVCHTSYTFERLGIVLNPERSVTLVSIVCLVCQAHFEAHVHQAKAIEAVPAVTKRWWQVWKRTKPAQPAVDPAVKNIEAHVR